MGRLNSQYRVAFVCLALKLTVSKWDLDSTSASIQARSCNLVKMFDVISLYSLSRASKSTIP